MTWQTHWLLASNTDTKNPARTRTTHGQRQETCEVMQNLPHRSRTPRGCGKCPLSQFPLNNTARRHRQGGPIVVLVVDRLCVSLMGRTGPRRWYVRSRGCTRPIVEPCCPEQRLGARVEVCGLYDFGGDRDGREAGWTGRHGALCLITMGLIVVRQKTHENVVNCC